MLVDIVLFEFFLFMLPLKVFKMRMLGRSFHTLIKNALFPSLTDVESHNSSFFGIQHPYWNSFPSLIDAGFNNLPLFGASVLVSSRSSLRMMWDLLIHPRRGLASSLAHRPVSGSDTIYNSSSPPLVDIVLFGFFLSGFPSRSLKCVC